MTNRYEFHARKSDATMVDNEHDLGPQSGDFGAKVAPSLHVTAPPVGWRLSIY